MHEQKLFQRMGQGDARAAEELFSHYYPQILRYCSWHVPIRSMAEDAAQETFLKALRYLDQYEHRGHFKAYLYRIAANVCIDMARKRWVSEESLSECSELAETSTSMETVETSIAIGQLVKALPKQLQEVLFLRYSQELTLKEISLVLNIPMRTVQSQLRTAIRLLKERYEKEEIL